MVRQRTGRAHQIVDPPQHADERIVGIDIAAVARAAAIGAVGVDGRATASTTPISRSHSGG
jgi:hypothetical protein